MSGAHERLSLNLATVRHASLDQAIAAVTDAGIRSIGIWRSSIETEGAAHAGRRLAAAGVAASGLCHSAPLCAHDPGLRARWHDENIRAIDEAAQLAGGGARVPLALVAGGLPEGSRDLAGARERVRDAIGRLEPIARGAGVVLAIEPFHPMLAADRSVIATLAQALQIAEQFPAESVGVIVDSWHLWWDPALPALIERAGTRVMGVQVADWLPATPPLRGQPGSGIVDFETLFRSLAAAGYAGPIEVEIFNPDVWAAPIADTVRETIAAFDARIAPLLSPV